MKSITRKGFLGKGFALPTVLIASVVLLSILAVSVAATTATRTALKNQYYTQLAQIAGEAGVNFAQACLAASGNVPTWTNAKPLKPSTDCNGDLRSEIASVAKVLVVAGGGGGGQNGGGGGGAGGYQYTSNFALSVGSFPVVVGAGGAASTANTVRGSSGGNSSFSTITAIGGGGGASRDGGGAGLTGGSGGGGGGGSASPQWNAGQGTSGQGRAGGSGTIGDLGCNSAGGGGGGAGDNGGSGSSQRGGNAGVGLLNDITGAPTWYAVGGHGGATCLPGVPGTPAAGGVTNTANPPANSGSGGRGSSTGTAGPTAGAAGVVIIAYPSNSGITATGGTVTQNGGYTVHRFTSNGTFAVSAISTDPCDSNPACYLTLTSNVRSYFSIGLPPVDSDGRAISIPQTGIVELLRESNGAVWRTYRQPSSQPLAVPALCSGSATSQLGWANADIANASLPTFTVPSAQGIAPGTAASLPAGAMTYRKDFNVSEAGEYRVHVRADDFGDVYIDGRLVIDEATWPNTQSATINLSAGCHVVHVLVRNGNLVSNPTNMTLGIVKVGETVPLVVTDRSWRVSVGPLVNFSETNYYQNPSNWIPTRDFGLYNAGTPYVEPTAWTGTTGDTSARWTSTTASASGNNYPFASFMYFRSVSQKDWSFLTPTQVQLSIACDDACKVYLNGEVVLQAASHLVTTRQVITVPAGQNRLAIELENTGTTANASGFIFSARRTSDNVVIDRSDTSWVSANQWFASSFAPQSYAADHRIAPDIWNCDCPTQGTTNMVANPSLVVDTGGYGGTRATLSRTSLANYTGTAGIRATVNALGFFPRVYYEMGPLDPGQVYTISAYIRSTAQVRIGYQYFDRSGQPLYIPELSNMEYASTTPVNSGGAWQRVSITTTPIPTANTENSNLLTIWVGVPDNTAVNTTFDVDALMVSPGPTLYQYRDGSSAGWRWVGGANASPSSGPATP